MTLKRYSTFSWSSELEPHHWIQFNVMLETPGCSWEVLCSTNRADILQLHLSFSSNSCMTIILYGWKLRSVHKILLKHWFDISKAKACLSMIMAYLTAMIFSDVWTLWGRLDNFLFKDKPLSENSILQQYDFLVSNSSVIPYFQILMK